MGKFSLKLLFHIVGIGSASGLFYKDGSIFLISDNGGYLYRYEEKDKSLSKVRLLEGDVLDNIPKKVKPDFEALAEKDGKLYIFGSGSTPNRTVLKIVDPKTNAIKTENLTELYSKMQSVSNIDADNLNIEGAAWDGKHWNLLQRGNGALGNNGIFKIGKDLSGKDVEFFAIELPKIKHVNTSFTDGVIIDGALWFLSAAEDTNSTYEDGEVLGSTIGKIDLKTMKVTYSEPITDKHKFEGITFKKKNATEIEFLLCEDNDSDFMESDVFELTVSMAN